MAPIIAVVGGAAGTTAFLIAKFVLTASIFTACCSYLAGLLFVAGALAVLHVAKQGDQAENSTLAATLMGRLQS